MQAIFNSVLHISLTASFVCVAVIIARVFLKTVPRWITFLLWIVVAIRLICPFLPESSLSLMPSFGNYSVNISDSDNNLESVPKPLNEKHHTSTESIAASPEDISPTFAGVAGYLWFGGSLVMSVYGAFSYVKLKLRLRDAVLIKDGIYQSEKVSSPFVAGILKPRIYVPLNLDKITYKQVVMHERSHIKRLDHIWKPSGFIILCIHWFNPIVWISYSLFCRDIEVACDEKVIKDYSLKNKKDYAMALLNCRNSAGFVSVSPLSFGEIGVGTRIKKTIKYKKPSSAIVVIGVVVTLVLSVCLLTEPVSAAYEDNTDKRESIAYTENVVNTVDTIQPDVEIPPVSAAEIPTLPATEAPTEPYTEPVVQVSDSNDEYYEYSNEYYSSPYIESEMQELELVFNTLPPVENHSLLDGVTGNNNNYLPGSVTVYDD